MNTIATITLNPALDVATSTPKLVPAHKLRCTPPLHHPGGGGINVARVIHALGGAVTALFPAGGPAGRMICRLLEAEAVAFAETQIAGDTRESFAVTEDSTGAQYRFVLPGPTLTPAEQGWLLGTLFDLPVAPDHLVVSGSLPPGIGSQFLSDLRGVAERLGAQIVLDTSAAGLKLAGGLDALLVKPSRRELEGFAGNDLPDDDRLASAARALIREKVARTVLVSLGSEGALLVTSDRASRFAPVAVPVVSSIGAGDSMVGALTLALCEGRSIEEAVQRGIAAGAAALLAPGTQLARPADVERLFAEMRAGVC
ncbi:1-phosphofructokinase family hexose kinase [Sphingomonas cannabina]|uniref:1-phosphofructokinase family hexose kinase n=1 Tax=Sphingomonas cannabina TaxID=2899123 RepID=UPI001F1DC048|nr:1-phosphofructokinase family hexose kinase [Sphingomonas cannabina]UIJ46225.1 1-phosphofructokinase family hexose kinase [Sphingomonas cannabina]